MKQKKGKKHQPVALDSKWIVLIVVGLVGFVAVTSFAIFSYYNEAIVARINGVNIRASQVLNELWNAENMLIPELIEEHPGIAALDYDLSFRGQTFGRAVREQAVKNLAVNMIFREHAVRLNEMGLLDQSVLEMNDEGMMTWVVLTIITNPDEFAAFEPYMMSDIELVYAEDLAQDILERLEAGEDFDTLMHEYSEDPGIETHPNGYTFTSTQMVSEFEQATRELEIGEISGLVRTDYGFHIILRIDPDPYDATFEFFDDDDEVLGAKHILIRHRPSMLDFQQQAILDGIQASANIRFRRALDDVPLR